MNKMADLLGGFTGKYRFIATFANLGGNMLHQHAAIIDGKYLADKIRFGGGVSAYMASKHII